MMDQTKWMNSVLNLTRTSFEAGLQSMDIFPQQAEKAVEQVVNNTNVAQAETRKAFTNWLENLQKVRKLYVDTFEEGFVHLEQQFGQKTTTKTK
ncbi:MAG: hypothetical protein GY847_10770 [Proteobacteria bacterium]|nr:hypothetical protein [Pseudomonadota bacterium]